MSVSSKVLEVTLAALLHDIGKPYQRAVKSDKSTLCDEAKGLEVGRGESSYAHAKWTSDFINRNSEILKNLLSSMTIGEFDAIASCHHNPSSTKIYEVIVSEADRASAGMDRDSYNKKKDDSEAQSEKYTYYSRPLDSIFSQILMKETESSNAKKYRLSSEVLFPQDDVKLTNSDYKTLCDTFTKEFKEIDNMNLYRFVDSCASLFTKIFQSVPSSTMEKIADIPLSDHAITTAAIASSMARAYEEMESSFNVKDMKFLWLSGDFGGIQKFIFSLHGESTKNLAKLLRGRSFFVNMLNVLTARYITDECGVPSLNALFSAGGKFQILLPDTPEIRKTLNRVKKEVTEWIYKEYFGLIKVYIDEGVSFDLDDFQLLDDAFKKNVSDKSMISINEAKKRPFVDELQNSEIWVNEAGFNETKERGKLCKICGREAGGSDDIGKHCNRFIKYGGNLVKSELLIITKDNKKRSFFGDFDLVITKEDDVEQIKKAHAIYCINSHSYTNTNFPHLSYAAYTPKDYMEKEATFDVLANEAKGLSALAVLKADVDNLGFIFSKGLGSQNSVSRRRTLSRLLDEFFTRFIPSFLKEKYPLVYTLFAGGDDLCLIGPWSEMISLASDIQEKFNLYIADNKNISISAGIELFHTGSPVYRAVGNAELQLEQSKNEGRNAITIFNRTMKWGKEYEVQRNFEKHWSAYLEKEKEPENKHSMLYRFLTYWKQWEECKEGDINKLRHRFQFIYDINRNVKKELITEEPFKSLVVTENPNMEDSPLFKNLAVGLSITMYKKRVKSQRGGTK